MDGSETIFHVRRRPMSVLPVSPKPDVVSSVETVANRAVICIGWNRKSMAVSLNIRVPPYLHFRLSENGFWPSEVRFRALRATPITLSV